MTTALPILHSESPMTRKDFFIAILDQFATNGNELLEVLNDIESGEVECFIEE